MSKQSKTFEESMVRLEQIVRAMERGDVALEESLKLFREGTDLVRQCGKLLDDAELQVKILTAAAKSYDDARVYNNLGVALTKMDADELALKSFEKAAKELLAAGIEVGYSSEVKNGFRVSEKEGGYYISFADADIEALISEYLREKVSNMLFKA